MRITSHWSVSANRRHSRKSANRRMRRESDGVSDSEQVGMTRLHRQLLSRIIGTRIFTGCTFAVLLFPFIASAVMQLMPPIQEINIQRGQRATFTITVRNVGDDDVPSTFLVHNMTMAENGAPMIADSSYERGFADWIVLDPPEAIIKANQGITLTGNVTVPRDAEGGYYAAIKGIFTGTTIPLEAEKVNIKGSAIELQSQALVVVLLTVPSSRNKAVLVPDTLLVFPRGEQTIDVDFTTRGSKGWKVIMPVRNEGNVHTRVSGMVSFWSESGARIESAPLAAGKGYVLPGTIRNFQASGENVLSDGYYMIRIALQTSENRSMANSFPFAVYEGEVYPGAVTDQLAELIRSTSPGFALKEPFLQKKITPGGSTYLAVQLINTRDDTLTLYPRKMEWNLNPVGVPTLGNDPSIQPRSCTPWTEFVDETIQVPPGRNASFKLKLNSPPDIAGEYYSAVVFDPDKPRPDLPAEFMAARTQLLAVSSPKDLTYQAEVDSITMKKESNEDLTLYRFYFTVRNTGNAHCFATGSMSMEKMVAEGIYDQVGKAIDFGDRQTFLLPNGERKFEIDVPNLEKGKYRIILATNYKEETQPLVKYQRIEIR